MLDREAQNELSSTDFCDYLKLISLKQFSKISYML
jgi:hypothetical protein